MSDNTEVPEGLPANEDNDVIRKLRADNKELARELKSAEDRIRAEIKREMDADRLLPDEFKGLKDVLVQEVDGPLDGKTVTGWLEGRGLQVPVQPADEIAAEEVQEVVPATVAGTADLGAAVAAASTTGAIDSYQERLAAIEEKYEGQGPGALPYLTEEIAQLQREVGG